MFPHNSNETNVEAPRYREPGLRTRAGLLDRGQLTQEGSLQGGSLQGVLACSKSRFPVSPFPPYVDASLSVQSPDHHLSIYVHACMHVSDLKSPSSVYLCAAWGKEDQTRKELKALMNFRFAIIPASPSHKTKEGGRVAAEGGKRQAAVSALLHASLFDSSSELGKSRCKHTKLPCKYIRNQYRDQR